MWALGSDCQTGALCCEATVPCPRCSLSSDLLNLLQPPPRQSHSALWTLTGGKAVLTGSSPCTQHCEVGQLSPCSAHASSTSQQRQVDWREMFVPSKFPRGSHPSPSSRDVGLQWQRKDIKCEGLMQNKRSMNIHCMLYIVIVSATLKLLVRFLPTTNDRLLLTEVLIAGNFQRHIY